MDVISRCAFALQIDGLAEPGNPFMTHALSIVNSPITKKPLILLPCKYFHFKTPISGQFI